LEKVRHVACIEHRSEAQKLSGITPAQKAALGLGRRKGTNNRTGFRHRAESREKTSAAHKAWCAENPDKVAARGAKTRGELHYQWKGGASKLAISIRQMTEHRRWMDSVKERDGYKCVECGETENIESHHKKMFSELLKQHKITTRDEARVCKELWDIENGITLCQKHHYEIHGRAHENRRNDIRKTA
jgi:hypothetical protein